jgi:hypothetical protein
VRRLGVVAAVLLVVSAAAAAQPRRAAGDRAPLIDDAAAERAVQAVKADPNLATERTIKTLRLRDQTLPRRASGRPEWVRWIEGLVRWTEQSARVVLWTAMGLLAAALIAYIVRTLNSWAGPAADEERFVAPTHVQDLDIRPETLPDDVGAAARRLWDGGNHRGALALLYRGLLSRLAHVHRLPVRDSSTEGDCLALARRLAPTGSGYAARLITTWQAAVYGHAGTSTAAVYALCDEFAPALDPVVAGEDA